MKNKTVLVAGLFTILWATVTPARADEAKHIHVTHDRFRAQTKVVMESFEVGNPLTQCLTCYLSAGYVQQTNFMYLRLYYQGKSWAFLKNHDTYLLVDGESTPLASEQDGNVNSNATTEYNIVSESVFISIDRSILARLISAQSIEMKVGPLEFKIKSNHVPRLRAFSEAVERLGPPPIAPPATAPAIAPVPALPPPLHPRTQANSDPGIGISAKDTPQPSLIGTTASEVKQDSVAEAARKNRERKAAEKDKPNPP